LRTEDADEAASEIFLVAWRRSDRLPADDEARLWLYGVARNVVRNWERSGRRRLRLAAKTASLAQPSQDGPEVHVIRNEEHREVIEAIATLSHRDQEVVTLKIWEGLSNGEVGAVLGLTDRAVEARYTRAIKKLSKHLKRGDTAATSSPFSPERGEAAS
jgi:RNA polymerase sigma-70 factor (ECF subfamily)